MIFFQYVIVRLVTPIKSIDSFRGDIKSFYFMDYVWNYSGFKDKIISLGIYILYKCGGFRLSHVFVFFD